MSFLRLIRFPNLFIVILTQYLLEYLLLRPAIYDAYRTPLLDHFHFALLVLSTVIIAAGGFIINDLKDYEIDLINKPDQLIINRKISASTAWKAYWGITIFGFLISLYLAFYVKNLPLVLIYPFAVLLLFLYSKSLKKSVLWGNLIVALFCAFVPGIVIFAEKGVIFYQESIPALTEDISYLSISNFFYYIAFAFFSTLYREAIKDIEDMEGDEEMKCRTLPIVYGLSLAKVVSFIFGLFLVFALLLWRIESNNFDDIYLSSGYFYFGLLIPVIISLFILVKAETKSQFHELSQLVKFIMLSGLIFLIILTL